MFSEDQEELIEAYADYCTAESEERIAELEHQVAVLKRLNTRLMMQSVGLDEET